LLSHEVKSLNIFKRVKESFYLSGVSVELVNEEESILSRCKDLSLIWIKLQFSNSSKVGVVAVESHKSLWVLNESDINVSIIETLSNELVSRRGNCVYTISSGMFIGIRLNRSHLSEVYKVEES